MRAHRGQLIEAGEELVQCHDQLLGRALGGQAGEAFDVSKQNAERGEATGAEGRGGDTDIQWRGAKKETHNEIRWMKCTVSYHVLVLPHS